MSSAVQYGPAQGFDGGVDVDIIVKVFSQTLFSPYFVFLVPVFYRFQGYMFDSPVFIYSAIYFFVVFFFWGSKWISSKYRNGGSLLSSPSRLDWGEQIVVVTGGASGIGELIANTLAVRNVTVVVLDVNPIETENYNITYYKCDVSKWEEVEAVSKKIVEEIGHPTVIINNAGVVQGKLIVDLSPEDIKQTFDVNVLAHFWTLKAFLPEMIKQKTGHIISVASVLGLVGVAQMTDYAASKAAIISLTDSLRYELDKRYNCPNIRTSVVIAGHTHTHMFSRMSLPSSWFHRFFTPSLQPYAIAKAVIAAIDEQESRNIHLPFYTHFVRYTTLLPSYLRDFVQWASGADYAMEGFVKVSGRRADEGALPEPRLEPVNGKAE
ncbi:retinal short-chain dehydrogenase/reductase [Schizopora paradoxa]|uniref:Short-chain dehydrogenase/reductase 3 n=1 Tax=Schizopora paradoxa TaxID=27342 RepID=A0A0H2SGX7_9AGAM|nr:retinal short-chain dehydrogenase/reductase [Schizopora paradoxa]